MMDLKKADKLKAYLNGPNKSISTTPFGTPPLLVLVPEHDNNLTHTDKERVYNQMFAQESLAERMLIVFISSQWRNMCWCLRR